jgi:hypothetical protein
MGSIQAQSSLNACADAWHHCTDVGADEPLPLGALAEGNLKVAKRCPPVLIRRSLNLTFEMADGLFSARPAAPLLLQISKGRPIDADSC